VLEYVGSVFLLPVAAALLAMLFFRLRLSLLAIIGTGHAGAVLVTVLRSIVHLPAIRRLGLFDPFLPSLTSGFERSRKLLSSSHARTFDARHAVRAGRAA